METVRLHGSATEAPAPLVCNPIGRFVSYLYTSNPFYAISAALILVALKLLFHDREAVLHPNALTFNSWLQLVVLAGYTALLATAGVVIVRLGNVWDDARTILLLVVLLLVANSVSFDKLVLTSAASVTHVLGAGLAFAVALSEGVIRGLRIRLPALFRVPFYLLLGLFFLYPVALAHVLDQWGEESAQRGFECTLWGILFFPAAAGVATLSLLPAAWLGSGYTADSGTPWHWPQYPWCLFLYLGLGVLLRSYYSTISFHAFPGVENAFSVYMLTPFLLSICVVLLELARSGGYRWLEIVSLATPATLLFWTLPGAAHSAIAGQFLDLYQSRAGSPVVFAWWGLLGLYSYGWLRGVRLAEWAIAIVLGAGSVIGRYTVDLNTLQFPTVEPLLAATMHLLVGAIRRPTQTVRWFLSALAGVGTLSLASWNTPFMSYAGAAPTHLLLGIILLLGLVGRDAFAQFLQHAGAVAIAAASLIAIRDDQISQRIPDMLVAGYLLSLSLVAWNYWYISHNNLHALSAGSVTITLLGKGCFALASAIQDTPNPEGIWCVVGSAASFAVGLAISLLKAGLWQRFRACHWETEEN